MSKMNLSEIYLLEVVTKLKVAKKNGELDNEEKLRHQDVKWRNTVEYDVLRTCMLHCSHKIRLETLRLLVESKKTTQSFTKAELDLIELFLTYNLGEKMEFVPLVKKALKRVNDSLAVLRRQLMRAEKIRKFEEMVLSSQEHEKHSKTVPQEISTEGIDVLIEAYRTFYISVHNICTNNLFPGASFDRRRSSLQILCIAQEVFLDAETKDLPWNEKQAKFVFDCLLLDTYESNKEMAYKVLGKIEPRLLGLDDPKKVAEIINVGVALANSIRPIDTITAAYMFKITVTSPVINDVVHSDVTSYGNSNDFGDNVRRNLVTLLMEELKEPLRLAKENILKAASKHSLYGFLFCLHSLISDCDLQKAAGEESWKGTIDKLVEMCFELDEAVSLIVNNSSPEGHLPMDLNPQNLDSALFDEEVDTEKMVTPQMVLLCSWHTVKEVSLLFGHLTAKSPISGNGTTIGLLTEEQVIRIGEHLVMLLSETKHRGAFEQAHVGFGQLCTRLWRLDGGPLKRLPKIWLHQLLLNMTGLTPGDSKLCSTRRSAGVPFMVQALLTSEPCVQNSTNTAFHSTMKILLGLTSLKDDKNLPDKMNSLIYENTAFTELSNTSDTLSSIEESELSDENKLTDVKTHALNILRALYKHSLLGDLVRPYVADGVITAINNYNATTWAERNAATLLFSALIVRIFGVQRTKDHLNLSVHNRMTGRIFFERYPSLLQFMLSELRAFVKPGDTLIRPSVQSVLLLLCRLYPSSYDGADSNWNIAEFVNLVSRCAKSQVYETRELAARALVPLLTEATAPETFASLFETIAAVSQKCVDLNTLHGYMLQVLQIARSAQFIKFEPATAALDNLMRDSSWILVNLEKGKSAPASFPLANSYIEVLYEIYKSNHKWFGTCVHRKDDNMFGIIERHLKDMHVLKRGPGREVYEVAVSKLFLLSLARYSRCRDILDASKIEEDELITAWCSALSHDNNDVQVVAWTEASDLRAKELEAQLEGNLIEKAVSLAEHKMKEHIDDPNVQEAVFDFLYTVLTSSHFKARNLQSLLESILDRLIDDFERQDFYVTGSYLRLLGQVYGEISPVRKDSMSLRQKMEIYDLFFENSWMDSSDYNCRLGLSQTMNSLFQTSNPSNDYFVLHWWTMLLNMLVDDDATIRSHAASTVSKVKPPTTLQCDSAVRQTFFAKFAATVGQSRPDLAMTALFSWGVAASRDCDYEMDESDVFNKCRNYECFEPLEIADLCFRYSSQITERYTVHKVLDTSIIEWLKKWFQCELSCTSFFELAKECSERVPKLTNNLDDILDPTYCDKLQQVLAFERFRQIASGQ